MTNRMFTARQIITMDPARPAADRVLVSPEGLILAVGDANEMADWGRYDIDDSFADAVLMPGLVEGHAHLMEGAVWKHLYLGHYDRVQPDGSIAHGAPTREALIERLKEWALAHPQGPLIAWGFDPLFIEGPRPTRRDLDAAVSDRPVVILHSNMHLLTANTAALSMAGYDDATDVPGVLKDKDGSLHGELHEMGAMYPVMRRVGASFRDLSISNGGLWNFARSAMRAGVTTSTDLVSELSDDQLALLSRVTADPAYPVRIVPMLAAHTLPPDELVERALWLAAQGHDRLRLGGVKIVTDGSIQGFTAQLRWPGYYRGDDNGFWNIGPEALGLLAAKLHAGGVQMHIHVNGDAASAAALDAIEAALPSRNWPDHRHTLQHCQMADAAQFRRMGRLGCCANLFANHLYYFGDKHYEVTVGPDRATRMNACRTALNHGVPLAIHSDAPITPLAPLFTAWCAETRQTEGGRVLGESERLTREEALYAVTLGAAYTLRLDGEVGSIEVGKRADFAVLEDDPLTISSLRDVRVRATVLGGRPTQAQAA
ncbi:amidohydrolase [Paracoccus suum]|uniref:Amidohydrolase n=1 Tax=Paracoccus suum TaxID=2259340 RepID=A0A344PHY7_9RHOB|nr:amidohydrolase [Paracoccus suum]AXC48992.1 amidohydrolase [Paracoccus suum]